LGYVGIPVLNRCAAADYSVVGADIDPETVDRVANGKHPATDSTLPPKTISSLVETTTSNAAAVTAADIVVVTVPTPIDEQKHPDFTALKSVIADVAAAADDEKLVVVESTVPPGTCESVVQPIFEDHDLVCGSDIFLAHAPERLDPNNDEWQIESIPRVVGALSPKGRDRAADFYESILEANIHQAPSIETAEASKIIENAFRDVNIAFVNELAKAFDSYAIDAKEAIDLAATKPYGFMPFYPGAGVGGHCIPVDPYLLLNNSQYQDVDQPFLHKARVVNEGMPQYLVERTAILADELEVDDAPEVLLLGVSFKSDIEDTRGSPYFKIRDHLVNAGFETLTYDPWVPEHSTVEDPYQSSDIAVVVTAHEAFEGLDMDRFAEAGVAGVVDGRNMFDVERVTDAGLSYLGIGRGMHLVE